MENKQIAVKILNADMLVLLDVLRKKKQEEIDTKSDEELVKDTGIDNSLVALSHSCVFVEIENKEMLENLFITISSISATLPYGIKEIYLLQKENKTKLIFSYRVWKILSEMDNELNKLEIKFEDIKQNIIKNGMVSSLKNELSIYETGEDMYVLIGKAYRETWDILNDLGYVYSTFRVYGCAEKKDRFSGMMCLFPSELDKIKEFLNLDSTYVREDLKKLFKD